MAKLKVESYDRDGRTTNMSVTRQRAVYVDLFREDGQLTMRLILDDEGSATFRCEYGQGTKEFAFKCDGHRALFEDREKK